VVVNEPMAECMIGQINAEKMEFLAMQQWWWFGLKADWFWMAIELQLR
jgi:hypothetical protein